MVVRAAEDIMCGDVADGGEFIRESHDDCCLYPQQYTLLVRWWWW
jgi:hypothetical protein